MADLGPVLAFSLAAEGGFSDDSEDPGGATNFGITIATLSRWRGHGCTVADVRALGRSEAMAIYAACFWRPIRGDMLPAGLDLVVFDFGINAGPERSAKQLQRILMVAQDGVVGPITLARAQCAGAVLRARIQALGAVHDACYRTLPYFPRFGDGWEARVKRCQASAVALAIHAAPIVAHAAAGV